MSDSKWAPIVYGRTYEVDFRFIVTPEDFEEKELEWAASYIRTTTRNPEKLPKNPRWLLLKSRRYCLVGVTCMVRELIVSTNFEEAEDFTRDSQGRPLYVFVGYVAQKSPEASVLDFPSIPPMDLRRFAKLYDRIREQWSEKSYDLSRQDAQKNRKAAYEEDLLGVDNINDFKELEVPISSDEPKTSPLISSEDLNSQDKNKEQVYLWPNEYSQEIWLAASQSEYRLSICLGLANEKDFIGGPFLNGTALDITSHKKLEKQGTPSNSQLPQQQPVKVQPSTYYQQVEKQKTSVGEQPCDRSPIESETPHPQKVVQDNPQRVNPPNQQKQPVVSKPQSSTKPPIRTRRMPLPSLGVLMDMGDRFIETLGTLGDIISPNRKIITEWRKARNQLEDLYQDIDQIHDTLKETQRESIYRNSVEAHRRLIEAGEAIDHLDFILAEDKITEAVNILKEATSFKQQYINFKFKREQPQEDSQEDDSLWKM